MICEVHKLGKARLLVCTCCSGDTLHGAHTVAQRLLLLRASLMQTIVSQEWSDWVKRGTAKVRDEAAAVKAFLLDEKEF